MGKNRPRAIIFGLSGTKLTEAERNFFSRTQPLGFILFERNVESPEQVKRLVIELKKTLNHDVTPVLIDQEGGRVARLRSPHWREFPPARTFGIIADDDPKLAEQLARDSAWLIGKELQELGINVNCAPCLDLSTPTTHEVIGDRSFSDIAEVASVLAVQSVYGFLEAGIIPVIKHLPGHGRAVFDTHKTPAPVYTSEQELIKTDFRAFRLLLDLLHTEHPQYQPWGMTAHVTYAQVDEDNPATQSQIIINGIIRGNIGFRGFLISDCITMEALSGSIGERALSALDAGCDAALHCNGNLDEMIEVAAVVTPIREESWKKLLKSFSIPMVPRQDNTKAIQWAFDETMYRSNSDCELLLEKEQKFIL